jgi:AAA+ superfamily predicted ATPase
VLYTIHKETTSSSAIEAALSDLRQIISDRVQMHAEGQSVHFDQWIHQKFNGDLFKKDLLERIPFVQTADEWIILMLAIVPHILPNFFESIIAEHFPDAGNFPEFGGVKGTNHRSMLPTGETAQFILAGTAIEKRLYVQQLFSEEHFFHRQGILWLEPIKDGEPAMSGRIVIGQEWIDKILLEKETAPRFGLDFPAKRITTEMTWDDLVLNQLTMNQVKEISNWLRLHHLFYKDENLKRKIKPGYRVLFYGPAGTGKTLTAALLGKQFEKDVYRIDLSQIVSKYIGETEKNLENVFKKAETKNWILFFDEADALFGKRTNVQSAHDKYANQEVSYLLQRVEDYPGLMILASNFKNNMDEAFLRRFHSLVHFPMPNAAESLLLWQKTMPAGLQMAPNINLEELSRQYEFSGASVLNAVQFAALQSYVRNDGMVYHKDLLDGIRKEYLKEDRAL